MKIGDRVIVNGEQDGIEFNNLKGKLIEDTGPMGHLIEFDEYISGNSYYSGKPGHCWWVPNYMIKKEDTMKERIEALEKELAALKDQLKYEPKKGRYTIGSDGKVYEAYRDAIIKERTKTGNCFDTKEKAEKARDIMVKHDIILKYVIDHAPDYEPDEYNMYGIYFDTVDNKWYNIYLDSWPELGTILMPEWVAEKLADDLNNNRISFT